MKKLWRHGPQQWEALLPSCLLLVTVRRSAIEPVLPRALDVASVIAITDYKGHIGLVFIKFCGNSSIWLSQRLGNGLDSRKIGEVVHSTGGNLAHVVLADAVGFGLEDGSTENIVGRIITHDCDRSWPWILGGNFFEERVVFRERNATVEHIHVENLSLDYVVTESDISCSCHLWIDKLALESWVHFCKACGFIDMIFENILCRGI